MRLVPPLTLLMLAPLIGEYLLGNIDPALSSWAVSAVPLTLLYGGGALLIRELARRLRRGYGTMLGLAVAYGLVEEGVVLGTLFNAEFLGLGLLDYGWIATLGTSPVWTIYVVGIHSVWSILVPIALTEHLFPAWSKEPWLGVPGTVAVSMVYLLGAALVGFGNAYEHRFFPSFGQAATVLTLATVSVVVGFALRRRVVRPGQVPHPRALGGIALLCGSGFVLSQEVGPSSGIVPAWATVVLMIALAAVAGAVIMPNAVRQDWSARHRLGLVTGAVATYGGAGFLVQFSVHGFSPVGMAAQCVFVFLAATLVTIAWRRSTSVDSRDDEPATPATGESRRSG